MEQFNDINIAAEESALENFSFGAFRINPEGKILFANKKFLRTIGFTSLDQLEEKIKLDNDFKRNFAFKKYFSYLNRNKETLKENRWVKNDGRTILLREFVHPTKNINGDILFIDCIVEDITEKHIIDKLIKDIKVGDYSILKTLPDFIFVLSNEGIFIDCKNNYHKLFPQQFDLRGNSVFDLFSNEVAENTLAKIKNTLTTGELQTLEFQHNNTTGIVFLEARFIIIGHQEVLMIIRDVTKQKEAEEQIKKITEELRILNSTKDKFFSIIGHDLRTPLNGLLSYATILSTEIDELSKDEIQEYTSYITEIAKSTNSLLNNLLEWALLQSGRINFDPEMVDLPALTNKIFNLLSGASANKNVELVNKVASPTNIFADKNMLQSILINLTSNAIKFSRPGGSIIIVSQEFDKYFKISVQDNGVGISKENIHKLFDGDNNFTTIGTAKEKGTGLGLILCKEFSKMHSGEIWVDSTLGIGTTINFTISKELATKLNN